MVQVIKRIDGAQDHFIMLVEHSPLQAVRLLFGVLSSACLISILVFDGAAEAMLAFLPRFANRLKSIAIPVTVCQK